MARIPPGVHVHGFAMRGFGPTIIDARGSNCSFDSVNWMLDARKVSQDYPWLTHPECVEIIAKRYLREHRIVANPANPAPQLGLFPSPE